MKIRKRYRSAPPITNKPSPSTDLIANKPYPSTDLIANKPYPSTDLIANKPYPSSDLISCQYDPKVSYRQRHPSSGLASYQRLPWCATHSSANTATVVGRISITDQERAASSEHQPPAAKSAQETQINRLANGVSVREYPYKGNAVREYPYKGNGVREYPYKGNGVRDITLYGSSQVTAKETRIVAFSGLPIELLDKVLENLDTSDLLELSRTCRRLREVVDGGRTVWRNCFARQFGSYIANLL